MYILFIGAHPDDIEIGCWSIVWRTLKLNHHVRFLILSDELNPAIKKYRREEAISSAQRFGIKGEDVVFMGMCDGFIKCDMDSISACRTKFSNYYPDIVIVHTEYDSHQDHRAANQIARSTFRKCPILSYSIFCSGESSFQPSLLSNLTSTQIFEKKAHLHLFESQRFRLDFGDMASWEEKISGHVGVRSEGLMMMLQAGSSMEKLNDFIEDCGFNKKFA